MISKLAPLMVLGMAAQSYYNKTKKGKKERKEAMKKKADLNKDGKMSGYEKKRSKAIQKAVLKKRNNKSSANTGDGTGAAQGKYRK
tara:strand:- start:214 stop:471 length:258 start_codon:yes stop_codon:yes gene_type:complete